MRPTVHQILPARAATDHPARNPPAPRFIRSSSAPLAPALLHTTQEQFGAPAIPAYGMTETAHQAASNPLPCDGVGKDASVGLPSGLQVRIITASGNPAKEVAMANDPQPTDDPEPGGSDILGPEPGGTDILGPETGGTDILGPEPGGTMCSGPGQAEGTASWQNYPQPRGPSPARYSWP